MSRRVSDWKRQDTDDDGTHCFVCKLCGSFTTEKIGDWRKKKSKDKNICGACLRHRELAKRDAMEEAKYTPTHTKCGYPKIHKTQGEKLNGQSML